MGILLDEDKLNELYDEFAEQTEQPNWEMFLLKKQLKKVAEWLVAECEDDDHEHGYSGCEFLRYECKDCRQIIAVKASCFYFCQIVACC